MHMLDNLPIVAELILFGLIGAGTNAYAATPSIHNGKDDEDREREMKRENNYL